MEKKTPRSESKAILIGGSYQLVGKWSVTMVIVSPLSRAVPLPNGFFMACKWGILTYESWDDPPSSLPGHQLVERFSALSFGPVGRYCSKWFVNGL